MTRRLQASGLSYLANTSHYKVAYLIRLELASSTLDTKAYTYLTNFGSNITYGGKIYEAGKVQEVSGIQESEGFKNNKVKVIVAGEFQEELDKALADLESNSYENKEVRILKAYLDDRNNIINLAEGGGPINVFQGFILDIGVDEDVTRGSSKVTWDCGSYLQDFERVNGRITSQDANEVLFPGDTGFQHSNRSINLIASYTAKETKYKARENWLGMQTGMDEYEVSVQRELTFGVNLAAEHLPVIYGVRKTPGIPIFIDVDRDDSSKVTVLYAICEGEIEGYMNIYVNGESVICLDQKPSEANCIESQKLGKTISTLKSKRTTPNYSRFYKGARNIDDFLDERYFEPEDTEVDDTDSTVDGDTISIATSESIYNLTLYHGSPNQEADSDMVQKAANDGFLLQEYWNSPTGVSSAYWDANSKLTNVAYIKCEFRISEEVNKIPEIEAVIDGKKVAVYNSPSTYSVERTLNPVWHLLDYITSDIYGGNLDPNRVDIRSWLEVAQDNDLIDDSYDAAWVEFWRYTGWPNTDPSNRTKIQCNSLIPTSRTVSSNVEGLLSQFDGSLVMQNGKFNLSIENNSDPVATIDVGKVSGKVKIVSGSNRKKWNTIKANIINPAKNWDASSITYYESNFLEQDNGIKKNGNVSFSHITNYYTARNRAAKKLRSSRFPRRLDITVGPEFSNLTVNDNILLDYPRFFSTPAKFRITEVTHDKDGMYKLSGAMYSDSVFAILPNAEEQPSVPSTPNISVPNNLQYIPLPDVAYPVNIPTGVMGLLVWDLETSPELSKFQVERYGEITDVSKDNVVGSQHYYFIPADLTPGQQVSFRVRGVTKRGSYTTYESISFTPTVAEVLPAKLKPVGNLTSSAGDDLVFEGGDLVIYWDHSDEKQNYEVVVKDPTGNVLRTTITTNNSYTYPLSTNIADYSANNVNAGAYRTLTLDVRVTDGGSKVSDWTSI